MCDNGYGSGGRVGVTIGDGSEKGGCGDGGVHVGQYDSQTKPN